MGVGGWVDGGEVVGGARVARRVRGNHVTGVGGSRAEDRLRLPLYAGRRSGDIDGDEGRKRQEQETKTNPSYKSNVET